MRVGFVRGLAGARGFKAASMRSTAVRYRGQPTPLRPSLESDSERGEGMGEGRARDLLPAACVPPTRASPLEVLSKLRSMHIGLVPN